MIARQGCLHPYDAFDAARTAFVIVDLQNYYTRPGFLGECAPSRTTFGTVDRLKNALRVAGGMVIWIQACSDGADTFWSHHHQKMLTLTAIRASAAIRLLATGFRGASALLDNPPAFPC